MHNPCGTCLAGIQRRRIPSSPDMGAATSSPLDPAVWGVCGGTTQHDVHDWRCGALSGAWAIVSGRLWRLDGVDGGVVAADVCVFARTRCGSLAIFAHGRLCSLFPAGQHAKTQRVCHTMAGCTSSAA